MVDRDHHRQHRYPHRDPQALRVARSRISRVNVSDRRSRTICAAAISDIHFTRENGLTSDELHQPCRCCASKVPGVVVVRPGDVQGCSGVPVRLGSAEV